MKYWIRRCLHNMNYLFDFLVLALIIFCAWLGKRIGFVRSFFGFCGTLISFAVSSFLARPVAKWLCEIVFLPILEKVFADSVSEKVGQKLQDIDFANLPDSVHQLLNLFGTDAEALQRYLAESDVSSGQQLAHEICSAVAEPVAYAISFAVAFFGLFIIISLFIRFLVNALDLIAKLPLLNFSNRLLGLGIGILWGITLAVILSSALTIAAPAVRSNYFFASFDPGKTVVLKFFAGFDFILSSFFRKG